MQHGIGLCDLQQPRGEAAQPHAERAVIVQQIEIEGAHPLPLPLGGGPDGDPAFGGHGAQQLNRLQREGQRRPAFGRRAVRVQRHADGGLEGAVQQAGMQREAALHHRVRHGSGQSQPGQHAFLARGQFNQRPVPRAILQPQCREGRIDARGLMRVRMRGPQRREVGRRGRAGGNIRQQHLRVQVARTILGKAGDLDAGAARRPIHRHLHRDRCGDDQRLQPDDLAQMRGGQAGLFGGGARQFQIGDAGQHRIALHPVIGEEEFRAGKANRIAVRPGLGQRKAAGFRFCLRDWQPVALALERIGRQRESATLTSPLVLMQRRPADGRPCRPARRDLLQRQPGGIERLALSGAWRGSPVRSLPVLQEPIDLAQQLGAVGRHKGHPLAHRVAADLQRVGEIGQAGALHEGTQPLHRHPQRGLGPGRNRQQERPCLLGTGRRSDGDIFLDHQMRVGAPRPEGAEAGAARLFRPVDHGPLPRAFPVQQLEGRAR